MARPGMLIRGYRRVKTAVKNPRRYLGIEKPSRKMGVQDKARRIRRAVPTSVRALQAKWNREAIFRKRRIGVGLGAAGVVGAGAYGVRKRRQRRK